MHDLRGFKSARQAGRYYATGFKSEEIIIEAMIDNPFRSKRARADFIEAVSNYVNDVTCRRNRSMNSDHE